MKKARELPVAVGRQVFGAKEDALDVQACGECYVVVGTKRHPPDGRPDSELCTRAMNRRRSEVLLFQNAVCSFHSSLFIRKEILKCQ